MRRAIDAGTLIRVRRSWLVAPDCDPRRVAAARVGGRITCVSAAAVLGFWDVGADDVHVALPESASRIDHTGIRVHTARGPVPVARRSVEDPLPNVLFQVARCAPPVHARAIWESAVRQDRIDVDVLARVRWRSAQAAELARMVSTRSDSGRETEFLVLMREIGVKVRQQVWVDGHPLDGLIGERLAVQIDGFAHHSRPADRRRDMRADARLALRGYTVLRFDPHQLARRPREVQQTVLDAIAQGLDRIR